MLINSFVNSETEIDRCAAIENCNEVLIETTSHSRLGKLTPTRANELANYAKTQNLTPVLVWDIIMTEEDFLRATGDIEKLDAFSSFRVYDIGAAEWIKEKLPLAKLQLDCQAGNHNFEALRTWEEYFNPERIILSIELPEKTISEYLDVLKTPLEVLGAGRIEIFYSPRKLLSNHFEADTHIEVFSSSEENHERDFPTTETQHGTFMYLDKDHFTFDKLDNLAKKGLHTARLDLRHVDIPLSNDALTLKKNWPNKTASTFFKSNKTDKQLKRKNRELEEDKLCVAKIITSEQGKFVLYRAIRSFNSKGSVKLLTADNKERVFKMINLKDLNHNEKSDFRAEELFFSAWIPSATAGSLLFKSID